MADERRLAGLMELRADALREMEAADQEFSRERMRVERMESDMRVGLPEPADYAEAKGRLMPRAEARVLDAYRELLKLEEKINLARRLG